MNKPAWTIDQINYVKRQVKANLDAMQALGGAAARLEEIVLKLIKLELLFSPQDQLYRVIYLISYLVHHERYGGLSDVKVRKMAHLAESIIAVNGISKGSSLMSFLYGEIHLVLSQIYRKKGDHWQAAWEQRLVSYTARKSIPGGVYFQALSSGIRHLRLGNAELAIQFFQKSEEGLKGSLFEKARLGRIKTLRLASRQEEGMELLVETAKKSQLSMPARREMEWEVICHDLLKTGDLTPMVKAIKKGGTHSGSIFVMEAALWFKSVEKRDWLTRGHKTKSLVRRQQDRPDTSSQFYKSCAALEDSYNSKIPLPIRLDQLGRVLSNSHLLLTMDKELLVWASAARVLARVSALGLASLALQEYVSLSIRLSSGRSKDALGICSDMLDRPWFGQIEKI